MNISDLIQNFIIDQMSGSDSFVISRNQLAERFACAPSQINYVLSTRFTEDAGYFVSSRRGGGGYIRILRVSEERGEYLGSLLSGSIGERLGLAKAEQILVRLSGEKIISERERTLLLSALSDRALASVPGECRDRARADAFKNIIITLLKED